MRRTQPSTPAASASPESSAAQQLQHLALIGASIGIVAVAVLEVLMRLTPRSALVEMMTNLRAQLLVVTFLLGTVLAFNRSLLAVLALVLMLANSAELARYAFPSGIEHATNGGPTMSVMVYNVFQKNTNYDAVVARVIDEDADVIVLVEITPRHLEEIMAGLPPDEFHALALPSDRVNPIGAGLALLSRFPLTPLDIPTEASPIDRPMLAATAQVDGAGEMAIVAIHPPADRFDSADVELRELQLQTIVELFSSHDGPAIVAGDFNIGPTSALYKDFLEDLTWRDPHRTVGWQATWTRFRFPIGVPIDHVLVSEHFEFRSYEVGDGAGSDHKTLVAELELIDPG